MVEDKVKELIAEQLKIDAATISKEQRLVEDLRADSANVMMLIMDLEQVFDVVVEDEMLEEIKTVGDVIAAVERIQSR